MRPTKQVGHFPLPGQRPVRQAIHPPVIVNRAARPTGRGAAVVGRKHDDGVVEGTERLQESHQPAEILVDTVEHRRVDLHVACIQAPVSGRGLVPVGNHRVRGGEARAVGNKPQRELTLVTGLAQRRPAGVVAAAVLAEIRRLRLQWRVHGVVRDIQEKWLLGCSSMHLAYETHSFVGPVVGGVVIVRVFVDGQQCVAEHQPSRKKEVRLASQKAVEVVEATLARP